MRRRGQRLAMEVANLETRGRGKPYPPRLRAEIEDYVEERRSDGVPLRELGDELGVSWRTLAFWSRQCPADTRPAFEEVEISEAPSFAEERAIIVHGPHGLRIEGLDVEQLAALVRRLG